MFILFIIITNVVDHININNVCYNDYLEKWEIMFVNVVHMQTMHLSPDHPQNIFILSFLFNNTVC